MWKTYLQSFVEILSDYSSEEGFIGAVQRFIGEERAHVGEVDVGKQPTPRPPSI